MEPKRRFRKNGNGETAGEAPKVETTIPMVEVFNREDSKISSIFGIEEKRADELIDVLKGVEEKVSEQLGESCENCGGHHDAKDDIDPVYVRLHTLLETKSWTNLQELAFMIFMYGSANGQERAEHNQKAQRMLKKLMGNIKIVVNSDDDEDDEEDEVDARIEGLVKRLEKAIKKRR